MIFRISQRLLAAGIILSAACTSAQTTAPAVAPTATAATTATTPATAPATAKAAELAITLNDNGKTVNLRANASAAIVLPGNATTGYSWAVIKVDGPAVEQVGTVQYAPGQALPNTVGSGGTFVARFRPVKAGQSTITMGYARPWEKDTPPGKTFTVTIVVDKVP